MILPVPGHEARLDFRDRLREEFARRRGVNRRYSLRAFGAYLGVDHSTLSQILGGRRSVPPVALRAWAALLNLGAEETEIYAAAAGGDDFALLELRMRRMQWIGEGAIFLARPAHWRLLQLLRSPDWKPDMRWAAARLGQDVDELNDALARLLRLGLLHIGADGAWRDTTGLEDLNEQAIKECALERMRRASSAI